MDCDIEVEDFRRNARLVAYGHITKCLGTIPYGSAVSHNTFVIVMTIIALSNLEVKATEISDAYIKA